ncbi:MAG: hypothetical protein J7K89_07550 [Candidatus Cloacimonetes bacterium]|nr:hypothetical protein [Candidatus Cloacimonadota bacterium]
MIVLYIVTGILLVVSWKANATKTRKALKIAWKRFARILPAFGLMVMAVAIVLPLIPPEFIARSLGMNNRWLGMTVGSLLGSISMMPGFIAYPLSGILLSQGVPYMVISAFTTTLMMVGVLSFPLEKQYLGTRPALLRNLMSLLIALLVAVITGFAFGEIAL